MKQATNNGKDELNVQRTAKAYGFLFPTSDEELKEFDKTHGSTKIQIPVSLQTPKFLHTKPLSQAFEEMEDDIKMYESDLAAYGDYNNLPTFMKTALLGEANKKNDKKKVIKKQSKKKKG